MEKGVRSTFKDARKIVGLSIEAAAFRLHIGTRTLVNYENGHSPVPPDVALKMAEVYSRPEIHARYCAECCPIGQIHANPVRLKPLEGAALGLIKEHNDFDRLKNRFIELTCDGVISPEEAGEFGRVLDELEQLHQAIETLGLCAMTKGYRQKERPRKAAIC